MANRDIKLEEMLTSLIERGGYSRNRQAILESVGITAAALSQYTRGHTRPSFQKLVALAEFFGVSLDYLVYGEPASAPIDHGPLAKYVEHALADVQSRTSRHSELVSRIGRLLSDRIDDVAHELVNSRTAGLEGLIDLDEALRMERYCRAADIVATDLTPNIISLPDGEAAAGRFFQVVSRNLARGCRYRFLLAGVPGEAVARFREMIADSIGGDRLHENCAFRRSVHPTTGGLGLYELDVPTFAMEEPGLFTHFSKYLLNGTWLGYLNRPNDDSTADMVMSPDHTNRAREAFENLWKVADSRT